MTTIQRALFLCALALLIGLFMPSAWCLVLGGGGLAGLLWLEARDHQGGGR